MATDPIVSELATVYSDHRADLIVDERSDAADGVVTLTLVDPTGAELPPWTPGAHIDVILGDVIRQYSLSGDPSDRSRWRIGVLREEAGRGGSVKLHDTVAVGDTVAIRGPRNHFPLHTGPEFIFIAGGIGITPLIPMIGEVAAKGATWKLVYGGRRVTSMAFREELTGKYGEQVQLWPEDEQGILDLARIVGEPRADVLIYSCGPEGLLSAIESVCAPWPKGTLHLERFSAKPQGPADPATDGSFEVIAEKSGVTVTVAEGTSIIDALEAVGVEVLSSCQEGVCGTCETKILAGIADHRDSLLTEEERAENEYMMICVGRSKTPSLTLDI